MDAWIRAQLENNKDILTLPYTAEYLKSIKDNSRFFSYKSGIISAENTVFFAFVMKILF